MKELFEKALPSRPTLPRFIIMSLCTAVCAALPGSKGSYLFTGIAFITAVVLLFAFTRTAPVLLASGLGSATVYIYTQNAFLAACACTVTVAVGMFSYLAVTTRSPTVILIIPAAYAVAVLAGGSLLSALIAIVPFPAAFVLAFCIGKRTSCVNSVCATSVTLGCSVLIAITVYVFVSGGKIDFSLLRTAADRLYDTMVLRYTEQFDEMVRRYAELGYDISKLGISAADVKATVATVYGVIPAIFAAAVNAVSYTAHKYSLSLIASSGRSKLVCRKAMFLDMDPVSVAIFLIAYIVMFLTSYSNISTVALVAENIYLIVLPGFAVMGLAVLLGRNEKKKKYIIVTVILVFLLINWPSISLAVLSFIGCSKVVKRFVLSKTGRGGNEF